MAVVEEVRRFVEIDHSRRTFTAPKVRTDDMGAPINRLKGAVLRAKLSGWTRGGGDRGIQKAKRELQAWLKEDRARQLWDRETIDPVARRAAQARKAARA